MQYTFDVALQAPATLVWQVVGEEYADIAVWASMVGTSSLRGELGVGAVRVVDGATEELVEFDRVAMALRYEAREGLPGFVTHAGTRWSVVAVGPDACRVRGVSVFRTTWWARPAEWGMAVAIRFMVRKLAGWTRGTAPAVLAWVMPATMLGYIAWSFVEFEINDKPFWEFLALFTALYLATKRMVDAGEKLPRLPHRIRLPWHPPLPGQTVVQHDPV